MGRKLYVGNLPYGATDQQLTEMFGAHGTVETVRIITDRFSGQSKGFGFVEMASDEEAGRAITALNGTQLEGRAIIVNEARPQEARPPRGGGGGGRRF